eukprot:TRINITY_DN5467_c0_g1_i2.p1 TRINITY_DN5467_c0_g1~~TRINITY_DN5467_c0_g1_i2.p1  ORF type:complete len:385 (-),score=57.18 TRINITY_DN5467_c0_g1_i2:197-1351(-)
MADRWPCASFQAVILAAVTGDLLYPLTPDIPQCLLPVANRPLLSFQLDMLEKAGFVDVLLVTIEAHRQQILHFLDEDYKGKVKVELVLVKEELESAAALRAVKDKIKTSFFVITSDLVTTASLQHMADVHRKHDATVTVLMKQTPKTQVQPGGKQSAAALLQTTEFTGLDHTNRLLLKVSAADIEETLRVSKSWIRRFPEMTIRTDMMDANLYVFNRWVMDLLETNDSLESIQGELIPFLVRKQFVTRQDAMQLGAPDTKDPIRCYTYAPSGDFVCVRATTLPAYTDLNRLVARGGVPGYLPWEPIGKDNVFMDVRTATLGQKTQIGRDCVAGAQLHIGEKSFVKTSIIGKHCVVGNNVKLNNAIIMDHVTIADKYVTFDAEKK